MTDHNLMHPLVLAQGLGYYGRGKPSTTGACAYLRALYSRNLPPRRMARALKLPR